MFRWIIGSSLHFRVIVLGVAIALVLVGTAMAFAGAIWGLLPRQSDLPRWGAAASVFDLLSSYTAAKIEYRTVRRPRPRPAALRTGAEVAAA